jgi:hypothetical protein
VNVKIAVAACLFWSASALAQTPETRPATQPATTQPAATQPAVPAPRTLQGTLTYRPLPKAQSVEAYEGVEFRLDDLPLAPSAAVGPAALIALDGRKVEVVCVMKAQSLPRPDEAYPMGADDRPLPRPARCEVLSVRAR